MKTILLTLLFIVSLNAQGPFFFVNGYADFYLASSPVFDNYVNRFNSTYNSSINKKMSSPTLFKGYGASANIAAMGFYSIGYSVGSTSIDATFNPSSHNMRELEINLDMDIFTLGVWFPIIEEKLIMPFKISLLIEGGIGGLEFQKKIKYSDGTTRTGASKEAGNIGTVGFGGTLYVFLTKYVLFFGKLTYNFPWVLNTDLMNLYEETGVPFDILKKETEGNFGGTNLQIGIAFTYF